MAFCEYADMAQYGVPNSHTPTSIFSRYHSGVTDPVLTACLPASTQPSGFHVQRYLHVSQRHHECHE